MVISIYKVDPQNLSKKQLEVTLKDNYIFGPKKLFAYNPYPSEYEMIDMAIYLYLLKRLQMFLCVTYILVCRTLKT